jgi:hypothetical protein
VLAAGKQGGENTQIRIGEQPAFRLTSGGSGSPHDGTEMLAAGHVAKVLGADPRQAGDFILCENFLCGFDRDHFPPSLAVFTTVQIHQKRNCRHKPADFPSKRSAVCWILSPLVTLNLQTIRTASFRVKKLKRRVASEEDAAPSTGKNVLFFVLFYEILCIFGTILRLAARRRLGRIQLHSGLTTPIPRAKRPLQLTSAGLLKRMSHLKHAIFPESRPINLQPDRKASGRLSGWN